MRAFLTRVRTKLPSRSQSISAELVFGSHFSGNLVVFDYFALSQRHAAQAEKWVTLRFGSWQPLSGRTGTRERRSVFPLTPRFAHNQGKFHPSGWAARAQEHTALACGSCSDVVGER